MSIDLEGLISRMMEVNASDLHLKVGSPPALRIDGRIVLTDYPRLMPADTEELVDYITPDRKKLELQQRGSTDFAYFIPQKARLRVNIFHQRTSLSIAMRLVKFKILPFHELRLPEVVRSISENERGLVLVTGITGSGKTTTLASIIDYINETRHAHIITIEDPIEYLFRDKRCIINQQEVGIDLESFETALRSVLRQDPDVILIGEMRDRATTRIAINAAETGHLVFSTLHTSDAMQTMDRILKYFSADEQELIRTQLSVNMRAIICQRLLPLASGKGRVPAVEILINTPIVSKLILQGRTVDIAQAIQNREAGMQSFDQSLLGLFREELITMDQGMAAATNPAAFRRTAKGGVSDGDARAIIGTGQR